jgi:hypothetical protein
MRSVLNVWNHIQRQLFPVLTDEMGPLTEKDRQFVQIIALVPLEKFLQRYEWKGVGCPPEKRAWLAHAFIAKSVYEFPTTRALIDALAARPTLRRLCGWESAGELPHEATFSRAFAEFAEDELPQKIHTAMVLEQCGTRLVGHVSRDSTAIVGCEKPAPKPERQPKAPRKRGRPAKGQETPPTPKRLDLQPGRTLAENLADLPSACAIGCKRNSKGHQECWIGYKLHMDTIDGDIPVSAILTSAAVNDSQVAIPLAQMTAQRIQCSLYDLMDSAYDAPQIHAYSRSLGHVPIIDHNPRRGQKIPLAPAQAIRFRQRTSVERVNSQLQERYGARFVRVRGAKKVMAHLMFGLIALTAMQLYQQIL